MYMPFPFCPSFSLLLSLRSIFYSFHVNMYTIEDISPLDAEVCVSTRNGNGSSQSSSAPETYIEAPPSRGTTESKKSVSSQGVSDTTNSSTPYTMSEFEKDMVVKETEVVKRGWRFYGTFACLALLNLICAIDATILSVALPVSSSVPLRSDLLTTTEDNCFGFKRHDSNPGVLVRNFVSLNVHRLPAFVGILFSHHRTEICSAHCLAVIHCWHCHRFSGQQHCCLACG